MEKWSQHVKTFSEKYKVPLKKAMQHPECKAAWEEKKQSRNANVESKSDVSAENSI